MACSELPANTGPPDGTQAAETAATDGQQIEDKEKISEYLAFNLIFLKTLLSKHC